jgi:hypothetical protein
LNSVIIDIKKMTFDKRAILMLDGIHQRNDFESLQYGICNILESVILQQTCQGEDKKRVPININISISLQYHHDFVLASDEIQKWNNECQIDHVDVEKDEDAHHNGTIYMTPIYMRKLMLESAWRQFNVSYHWLPLGNPFIACAKAYLS